MLTLWRRDRRKITFSKLYVARCQFAFVLRALDVNMPHAMVLCRPALLRAAARLDALMLRPPPLSPFSPARLFCRRFENVRAASAAVAALGSSARPSTAASCGGWWHSAPHASVHLCSRRRVASQGGLTTGDDEWHAAPSIPACYRDSAPLL